MLQLRVQLVVLLLLPLACLADGATQKGKNFLGFLGLCNLLI